MSTIFDDYEVLNILGSDTSSVRYKMRNKKTSKVEVWTAVNCDELGKEKREGLISNIRKRASETHLNLLRFYDCISSEEINTLYIVTEHCKYDSLHNLMHKCVKRNKYFSEDFLFIVLYKIALSIKNLSESILCEFSAANIYLDDDFNIKYYNFDVSNDTDIPTKKDFNFGKILHELCTLKNTSDIPNHYTHSLRNMCTVLLDCDLKCSLDIILHHPTVLQKAFGRNIDIFIKNPIQYPTEDSEENISESFLKACAQNLRNRELLLRANENKLKEKEHRLHNREKKVTLLERMTRQKIVQADLYLRRSQGRKSSRNPPANYEKIDTSFSADCGDSIIVSTSRKLDIDELTKPRLSRTCSERRVKFKGHSPLKEIHNTLVKENIKCRQSMASECRTYSTVSCSAESVDSQETGSDKIRKKFSFTSVFSRKPKAKVCDKLLNSDSQRCEDSENQMGEALRPISWSEENKRQAFALLKMMNDEQGSNCTDFLKQTML